MKKLTNALIAKHFDVHPSTVADWVTKGCPKTTIEDVARWRSASLRPERMARSKRCAPGGAEGQLTLQERRLEADIRKIMADVALREFRIEEKRRSLLSRKTVVRHVAELVLRIKARLMAVPDEFEMRFPAEVRAQCKADLEDFVRQLLSEMSRWRIVGETCEDQILAAAEQIRRKRESDRPNGRR